MGSALALALLVVVSAGSKAKEGRLAAAQNEFNRGNFDAALKDLELAQPEATDLATLTRIQLLRAQSYGAKQDFPQAESALAEALEFDPEAALDPARVDPALVKVLDSLRARLKGELHVNADQPNVKVKLDGEDLGTTPLRAEAPIGRHTLEAESADGKAATKQQVVIRRSGTQVQLLLTPTNAGEAAPAQAPAAVGLSPVARSERSLITFGELRLDLDMSVLFQQGNNESLPHAIWRNLPDAFGEAVGAGIRTKFFRASAAIRFRPVLGIDLRGALSIPLMDKLDGYVSAEFLNDLLLDNGTTLMPGLGAFLGAEYFIGSWFGLYGEFGARHYFYNNTDDIVLQGGLRIWFP